MQTLPNISIGEQICENERYWIFRGDSLQDKKTVRVKILKGDPPSPTQLAAFEYEYRITRLFRSRYILQAASLQPFGNSLAMVMEDFPGLPLSELIKAQDFTREESLQIAIQLTDALYDIHRKKVVYRDLNPTNIVYNRSRRQLKIAHFTFAVRLSHTPYATSSSLATLAVNLSYVSPELTGRLKKPVDHRTDFYSLGIILYELLTGGPPFSSTDPDELIKQHLTQEALSPDIIIPEIFPVLSRIILKMIEKSAENRYFTCAGLRQDLLRCLQESQTFGEPTDFHLGLHDVSDVFSIPATLYGRTRELSTLMSLCDSAAKGATRGVVIGGPPGIGKTALVMELKQKVFEQRGLFITGRFERPWKGPPYQPLVQAVQELAGQILREGDTTVRLWKNKILSAVYPNGRIIVDLIPEMEKIIGGQPSVPELAPLETENRFLMVFSSFLQACAALGTPLVLFLDDLQWADPQTLRLLDHFLINCLHGGLLFVGAYDHDRDSPPLPSAIESFLASGQNLIRIFLPPLGSEDVAALLSDTLSKVPESLDGLVLVCLNKTGGNPFVLREFLHSAHTRKHIFFNSETRRWQWNIQSLEKSLYSGKPQDVWDTKIERLAKDKQSLLCRAAVLGDSFSLEALAIVCEQSTLTLLGLVDFLIDEGFFTPITAPLLLSFSRKEQAFPCHLPSCTFRFTRSEIRQAALARTPEDHRITCELSMGRLLKSHLPHPDQPFQDYVWLDYLNAGIDLIDSPEERLRLAQTNLQAGRKALDAAAYDRAFFLFKCGLRLLPEKSWTSDYSLTFALYLAAAQAAALGSRPTAADDLFEKLGQRSVSPGDTAKVYTVRFQVIKARKGPEAAIEAAVGFWERLGFKFPSSPGKSHVLLAFSWTKFTLKRKQTDDLLHLPEITDPEQLAIFDFLCELATASLMISPELFCIIGLKMLRLSQRYGMTARSAIIGYAIYGLLQFGLVRNNLRNTLDFLHLMEKLQERENRKAHTPYGSYLTNRMIMPWKQHIRDTLVPFRETSRGCRELGDTETAALALCAHSIGLFLTGANLGTIREELKQNETEILRLGQPGPLFRHRILQQAVDNLLGANEHPVWLVGRHYNEKRRPLSVDKDERTTIFLFHLIKMMLAYIFGDMEEAGKNREIAGTYLMDIIILPAVPFFLFYSCLIDLACLKRTSGNERIIIPKQVVASQQRMKTWADHAPMNYLNKFLLVEAESAHILGRHEQALAYFDQAIASSRTNGYLMEEALAYEMASDYHLQCGRVHIARPYLQQAHSCYQSWGAAAKTRQLGRKTLLLRTGTGRDHNPSLERIASLSPAPVIAETEPVFNARAFINASQLLMGEIIFDQLLDKMMAILIDNSGAHQGALLFKEKNQWCIRARGTKDGQEVFAGGAFTSPQVIPKDIIEFVEVSRRSLNLKNPSHDGFFTEDIYVLQHRPQSILCLPILNQEEISYIIYLENNLEVGVFSCECQELIELIGSQASISLRNSSLYTKFSNTVDQLHAEIKKHRETQLQLLHSEKLSALGRLSASIAHEFGNPLIGVRYLIEDLRKRPALSKEDRDLLGIGLEECDRMKHLIDDLQQLNRPSSGKRKRFNVHHAIDNVLLFQKKYLKSKKISIVKAYNHHHPDIMAVEDQIMQVLVNLTINAVDAMPAEGGVLTVTTGGDAEGVTISIQDTGIGILPEYKEHIFEPFFSTKAEAEGTGLGLSVSYGIVAGHGGRIDVLSKPGQGSTFTVTLPVNLAFDFHHLLPPKHP